jgi:hypothetical protein
MKTTLTISVFLNVLLLGGAFHLWQHSRLIATSSPATQVQRQISPVPVVQTVIAPFRWSQLLSTNGYPAFATNLRRAGCPESTVDDIVRGDTARAYAMMRDRLGVSATTPGRWSAQAQMQMTAYFLGQPLNVEESANTQESPTGLAAAGQNDQANQTTDTSQTGNAALAVFLQNTDFTTPDMTADQKQEIAGLRLGLLAQISAPGQAQNSQSSSSTSSPDNAGSSQFGVENTQSGADDSQATQGGQNGKSLWHEPSPTLLQAAEEESILGGLFGTGAAMQFDQYQPAQGAQ